jgi:hypothetical protein
MCSARPPKSTDNGPEDEGKKSYLPDVLRRRIAEAAVLALYFVFEFPNSWHESHERALVQLVVGLSAVALIEFRLLMWTCLTAIFAISAYSYYMYQGPTPPEETANHGWLIPGNDPQIETNCHVSTDTMMFVAGTNVAWSTTNSAVSLILEINGTPLAAVVKDGDKLAFDIDLLDDAGNLAVRIEKNGFYPVQGQYSYIEDRQYDRTRLIVHDKKGNILLNIHYANPRTVFISGIFHSSDGTRLLISDDRMEYQGLHGKIFQNCYEGGINIHRTPDGGIIIQ